MAKETIKKSNSIQMAGSILFIVGVVIAVVFGFIKPGDLGPIWTTVLIVAGLIVGFLNVTTEESNSFLIAAVTLVIVTGFGSNALLNVAKIGERLAGVLAAILIFVVPATIIVALKSIYGLAKEN